MSTPENFNWDEWLSNASRPTRSVTIVGAGNLLGEMEELAERIQLIEAGGEPVELSAADADPSLELRARYQALYDLYTGSALTITLTAHLPEEREAIVKASSGTDQTLKALIADAITPKMTVEQVGVLYEKIGSVRFHQIVLAYQELQSTDFEPSADFLPKRSSTPEE